MSFTIQHGLFQLDSFTDYHAILGLPLNADFKQIRKRYLKIAQSLHPDTCKAQNDAEREQGTQILSKLVNPAYEKLSKAESFKEYQLVLSQTGKRLAVEGKKTSLKSELAIELSNAGPNLDMLYHQSVEKLATQQYQAIANILKTIAQLSELNLVYLMEKEGKGISKQPQPSVQAAKATTPPQEAAEKKAATAPTEPEKPQSPTAAYIRRAESYIERNNFAKAVLELRDALKIDPNDSRCHSLLGWTYLKQNQISMAKVHITKALASNPQDPTAIQGKQALDKMIQATGGKPKATASASKGQSSNQSGSGGFFGGLFGKKK